MSPSPPLSPRPRLFPELLELCELLQPTAEEAAARQAAVAAVAEVAGSLWPSARCEVFGSFATGLYVPTSDVDLVIMDSGCRDITSGLKALAAALARKQVAKSIQVSEWRSGGKGLAYRMRFGCEAGKRVHTGEWGCGGQQGLVRVLVHEGRQRCAFVRPCVHACARWCTGMCAGVWGSKAPIA